MQPNTHVYIAHKAIEFLRDSVDNLTTKSGKPSRADTRPIKDKAKKLQRLMLAHKETIIEASWAPDDIINDKTRYHTFKLFTDGVFNQAQADAYRQETHKDSDQREYHRGSGGGGLPFKVDHLAAVISDLRKLRSFNDNFSVREIQYLYILISHYIVDAHVPMHCDLRDDPPSATDKTKPGPTNRYFREALHGEVEAMWDRAVTPLAIGAGIMEAETHKDLCAPNDLTDDVEFDIKISAHRKLIRPVRLEPNDLMEFMIQRCIDSHNRSHQIWPPKPGSDKYSTKEVTKEMTRTIIAESIAGVISVWLAI